MIRSKIEARERALELAVKTFETSQSFSSKNFMEWVTMFEKYLIGDVDLPEVVDDNAYLKELFAVAQREMAEINNRDTVDNYELLKTTITGNTGILAEMPCKSDAE